MYVTATIFANDDTRSGDEGCDGELEKQSTGPLQAENTTAGQQPMDSNTNTANVMCSGVELVATFGHGPPCFRHAFFFCHSSIVFLTTTTPSYILYTVARTDSSIEAEIEE